MHYLDWLTNVIMVKKKNGKNRVCIYFIVLNKSYPKDSFSFSMIDKLVNGMVGYEMMSFLGYNQILMHPDVWDKTSFMIERDIYCYKVTHFCLKNAGVTYQCLINQMFKKHIRKTMEVHIDDLLVNSLKAEYHFDHMKQTFDILDKYRIRLYSTKCTFGVLTR